MADPVAEMLAPKPLSMDDVQKLIGSLYLEIDMLRRHVQTLRAHLEANGMPRPAPDPE